MSNELDKELAKILLKTEQKLGRKLTDAEIRKIGHIPPKQGTTIRHQGRQILVRDDNKIDPKTGKPWKEDENDE